jgi:hypothetical protein
MLGMILPANVESEERFGEAPGGVLFPEEEKIIAHAVEARRREFATVRVCARACLARLGYAQVPILPGVGGTPTWPAGVQGSMTHCAGYAAAAVGPMPPICKWLDHQEAEIRLDPQHRPSPPYCRATVWWLTAARSAASTDAGSGREESL